jgi:branched-chain amino acid transport system permease protein
MIPAPADYAPGPRTTGGAEGGSNPTVPPGSFATSAFGRVARWGSWVVVAAALVVLPLVFSNPTVTSIAVFSVIFMASATAWNFFSGYSGYICLGHAAFFGSGAYALTIVATDAHFTGGYGVFWLVPLGGLVAAAVAVPFGVVALRTRRHTFVVVTIAFFFIFQLLATNLSFTGGSSGEQAPTPSWTAVGYNDRFYYAALICLAFAFFVSVSIRRSRFGLQLLAIRDDEDRASGLGVRVTRVKLIAFVLSAFATGMAGAVWAYFLGQVYPQFAFDPLFDLSVAIMAFFGGLGTLSGPLIGAAVLESLQQYFTIQFSSGDIYLIAYGALFLVVILAMPRGVVPTIASYFENRREKRIATFAETASQGGVAASASGQQGAAMPGLTAAVPGDRR